MSKRPILSLRLPQVSEVEKKSEHLPVSSRYFRKGPDLTDVYYEAAEDNTARMGFLRCLDQAKYIGRQAPQDAVDYFSTFIDGALEHEALTDKDKIFMLMTYVKFLTQLDDFDMALNYAEKACSLDTSDIKSLTQLATIQKHMGDYDAALKTYKHAQDIDPTDKFLLTGLGGLYEEMGNNDKAAEFYETVLIYHRDDRMARNRLNDIAYDPF